MLAFCSDIRYLGIVGRRAFAPLFLWLSRYTPDDLFKKKTPGLLLSSYKEDGSRLSHQLVSTISTENTDCLDLVYFSLALNAIKPFTIP